jgi:hypothetical protein
MVAWIVLEWLVGDDALGDTDEGPAVLVLSPDDRVTSCTRAAEELLDELAGFTVLDWNDPDWVPTAIRAVAQLARDRLDGTRSASAWVRTRTGGWFAVHGAVLNGEEGVAVVIRRLPLTIVLDVLESIVDKAGLDAVEDGLGRLQ